MKYREIPEKIRATLPPALQELDVEITKKHLDVLNSRFPDWESEGMDIQAPTDITYRELPAEIYETLPPGLSEQVVTPKHWEVIGNRFPELIKPITEFDPETGKAVSRKWSTVIPEATPTTDMQPIDVGGRNVLSLQEATSKGRVPTNRDIADSAEVSQEGGLFVYEASAKGPDGKVHKTKFRREKPLSPVEKQAIKTQMVGGEGGVEGQWTDFTLEENVADEPKKVLQYLIDNGKIPEQYIENGKPTQELIENYALAPTQFRLAATGEDKGIKKFMGLIGDAQSMLKRKALGYMRGDTPEEQAYEAARTSPDPKSGFWSQLGQAVMQDRVPIPSFVGAGAIKAGVTGLKPAIKAVGTLGAIGAAEGVVGGAMDEAANLRSLSAGDYALEGGLSAGMGVLPSMLPSVKSLPIVGGMRIAPTEGKALPGLGFAFREGRDYLADRPPGMWSRFQRARKGQLAESSAAQTDLKIEDILRTSTSKDLWNQDDLAFWSKELDIPAKDLYPGLGLSSRHSELQSQISKATRNNPTLNKQAHEAKLKIDTALDKRIPFKNAPSPEVAGREAKELLTRVREAHFKQYTDTYASLVKDPDIAGPLDKVLLQVNGPIDQARRKLDALELEIRQKQNKTLTTTPDGMEWVREATTAKGELSPYEVAANFVHKLRSDLQKFLDNPELTEPGSGKVLKEIEKRRANLRDDWKNLNLHSLPPELQKQVNNTYMLFADIIQEGLEKVNPAKAKALKETNEGMSNYFTAMSKLGKWDDSTMGNTALFEKIVRDPQQMLYLRNLSNKYLGTLEPFNAIRDAWFRNKVVKVSAGGDISDKQRGLKSLLTDAENSNDRMEYFSELYPKANIEEINKIVKALFYLGNPDNRGLATEVSVANASKLSDLGPAGMAKQLVSPAASKEDINRELLGGILSKQQLATKGIGVDIPPKPPTRSEKFGVKVGEAQKNLRALATEGIYQGARNVDDTQRPDEKTKKWKKPSAKKEKKK